MDPHVGGRSFHNRHYRGLDLRGHREGRQGATRLSDSHYCAWMAVGGARGHERQKERGHDSHGRRSFDGSSTKSLLADLDAVRASGDTGNRCGNRRQVETTIITTTDL